MTDDGTTLSAAVRNAAATLRSCGVPDAANDARILLTAATGLRREDMLREPDLMLEPESVSDFEMLVRRRADREPVSRILGRREFRSLVFELGTDTLDPRPDSEVIVETVIDYAGFLPRPATVLDLGTGTGCLLLSVLNDLPNARGVGTDINPSAVEMARLNALRHGLADRVEFLETSWADAVNRPVDIVVSNPPYIRSADISGLAPEVADYDPRAALDGGSDGLDAYRALAKHIPNCLAADGIAVLEIGAGQKEDVEQIFIAAGFQLVEVRDDFGGHARGLVFSRTPLSDWLIKPGKKGLESE